MKDLKAERDRNAQLQKATITGKSQTELHLQQQLDEMQLRCTQLQAELAMQRLQNTSIKTTVCFINLCDI